MRTSVRPVMRGTAISGFRLIILFKWLLILGLKINIIVCLSCFSHLRLLLFSNSVVFSFICCVDVCQELFNIECMEFDILLG